MEKECASQQSPTSTVVGIDEAGYGPLLGPLVVSAAVFDVPVAVLKELKDPAAGPDLWALLRASLTRKPARRDARLAVADSKKLFKRSSGKSLALLERAALTFVGQVGDSPRTLRDLLNRLCPGLPDAMQQYPWYKDVDVDLPGHVSADDLATQRNALKQDLATNGVRFRGIYTEILPAGHFNQRIEATKNKAVVLFGLTTRLMQRVADDVGTRPLRIWVDRQGGRTHYRRPLMTAFQEAELDILEESPDRCGYRLTHPFAPWAVRFVKNGETHHLPIALASIISKYTRELLMGCFNRYWTRHVPGLKPTAGYYQDGKRFLADIDGVVCRLGIDRATLIRSL